MSTSILRKGFSERVTTNWSCEIYTITNTMEDTNPSSQLKTFPVKFTEAILESSKLTKTRKRSINNELEVRQSEIILN